MKVTSITEAKALEQYASPEDCKREGKHSRDVRKVYSWAYGLTLEEMEGYDVHHLCGQGYECLNVKHLVLMTHADHARLERTGKTCSAETLANMSVAQSGENNPMFGKTHSDKHKAKMSVAMMGNQYAKGHVQTDLDKRKKSLSHRIRYARNRGDMELANQLQVERDALD